MISLRANQALQRVREFANATDMTLDRSGLLAAMSVSCDAAVTIGTAVSVRRVVRWRF